MPAPERDTLARRRIAPARGVTTSSRGLTTIAVASGKGGVGKTQIAVNLAIALAKRGRRTLLLDADLGLANVDVLLGLQPTANLEQVLAGERTLADVVVTGPAGLKIVPGGSGVSRLANLSSREQCGLVSAFSSLPFAVETMVIDVATGVDRLVLGFCGAASEVVVVLCDEPASMTDAYALVKLLARERGIRRFQVLCNRVQNRLHGRVLFERFLAACDRFLDVSLSHFGSVPEDPVFGLAAQVREALVDRYPSSNAGAVLKELAVRADTFDVPRIPSGGPTFFVERMLAAMPALPAAGAR
jgi:flagellar biosynthesis protein FlhG